MISPLTQFCLAAALSSVALAEDGKASEPATIAFLAQNRFDLQNDFLSNLLSQLEKKDEDFKYEFVSFDSIEEINDCLADGSCVAALDYLYTGTSSAQNSANTDQVQLPILNDPVIASTIPKYGRAIFQSGVVTAYWFVGIFAFFVIFGLFITRFDALAKPVRADVRTASLTTSDPGAVDLFSPPEEDLVYAGIRKANQVFTCNWSRSQPLQAIIIQVIIFITLLILIVSIAVQVSLLISRDIAVETVNDLALKSQIDGNLICADSRFRPLFDSNLLADPEAFEFKKDPSDFLGYTFVKTRESITDCASLVVYQSSLALVPEQFSDARKRMQHVGIIQDIPIKEYPLLLSKQADTLQKAKIVDFIDKLSEAEDDELTMRKILLQDTLQTDASFIALQNQSLEAQVLLHSTAYQHCATFALACLVGYYIQVLTQLFKDKDRFFKKDFYERIELMKVKIKLQQQKLAKKQALDAEGTAPELREPRDRNINLQNLDLAARNVDSFASGIILDSQLLNDAASSLAYSQQYAPQRGPPNTAPGATKQKQMVQNFQFRD